MSQIALEEKLGILEITLKEKTEVKKSQIYAFRLNGNGYWKYQRSNGQILNKKSSLNPKQMAHALGEVYCKKNMTGEIRWVYIKPKITNHTH